MPRWLALLVLFVPSQLLAQDWESLRDSLAKRVEAGDPGFAVLVLERGQTVFAASHGMADLEAGRAITGETPFYIASLGKTLTALAIMQLAEAGKLQLDQRISSFVPELPSWLAPVRIDRALTHTSGMPDYPEELAGETSCLDNDDVIEWLKAPREPPSGGKKTVYSNAAYVLLAEVVEVASGLSYPDYLHQRIFEPAAMRTARVVRSPAERPAEAAIGYRRGEEGWAVDDYQQCTLGPGGLYASVADLAAFDRALREGRLLGPEAMSRLYTPATLADGSSTAFSPGWISGEIRAGELVGLEVRQAFGNLAGFHAALRRFVNPAVTIIWLSNRGEALFDAGIETAAIEAGLLPTR
ncbi:MAG: serine hydrolase domain-containing protein [Xanthomonadales bacterium]|nr:serine hydrolase domain-containing protein [Xanthomonadales bacterium]